MKLYKKSERILKTSAVIHGLKAAGAEVKNIGEYAKWKELDNGAKIQIKMDLYEVTTKGNKGYFFSDSFGMLANQAVTDIKEIHEWLDSHNFKTLHDFYIEDYGMSEETWEEWNK